MTIEFDNAMLQRVRAAVRPGDTILTLGKGKPNRIVDISRDGVLVETEASVGKASGPQLVPAWMVIAGWEHLAVRRTLTQAHLLKVLNVKRSAFVCALLAQMPGIEVQSTRPVVLRRVGASMVE